MESRFADRELAAFMEDLNAQRLPSAPQAAPATLRQAAEQRAGARPKGPEMHAVRNLLAPPGGCRARPSVQALIYANTDLGNSGASMHRRVTASDWRLRTSSGSTRSGFPIPRCAPIRERVACSSLISPAFRPPSSLPASTTRFETRGEAYAGPSGGSRRYGDRAP